jgi:predicted amidohydrolase YtcJ
MTRFEVLMSRFPARLLIFGVLFCFLALLGAGQQAAPDCILFNGKIFTSGSAHPYVEALAIRGERIVAADESVKVQALAGPQTRRIDLGGRTVIPGINDAHMHLELQPTSSVSLSFKNRNPSWAEVKDAIAGAV